MRSNIGVRALVAGAAVLALAAFASAGGLVDVANLAAGTVLVTLAVLLALLVFAGGWEPPEAPADAVPEADTGPTTV